MMSYFIDDVVGVACFKPLDNYWNGKVVFDLNKAHIQLKKSEILLYYIQRITFCNRKKISKFEYFLKNINPNIIFINFIGPALYLKEYLNDLNIPIIIHVHGVDAFIEAKSEYTGMYIHSEQYKNEVFELSQKSNIHFIANSRFTIDCLQKFGLDNSKIHLKYFGVDISHNIVSKNNKCSNILYIGRFVDFKGPDLVLSAFYLACDLGFKGKLTMVGDGPLKPMCLLLNSRSKYSQLVQFFEPATPNQVIDYMANADIFTMHNCYGTSSMQSEAFGVTMIEAMSLGLPVVNANTGGVLEIIENMVDGILVDSFDVFNHAQAFILLQHNENLRELIANNAKKKIDLLFNSRQEESALSSIIDNIMLNQSA